MDRAGEIPDLLERDEELARIEAALDGARAGHGSTLLIEGPAGIGKTVLLRWAEARAGDAFTRLSGRPTELEREFAFGVVRQLLESPLRGASAQRRAELLSGEAGNAGPALGFSDAREAGGFATLNGLYWLVATLAEGGPLLLTVDDAQWADSDSLRFLAFLAPRVVDLPVLLLVAARGGEWQPDPALAATASDAAARALEPQPLSEAAGATVVRRALGDAADAEFAAACHAVTAGNPFYLHALVEALAREGIDPTRQEAARVHGFTPRAVIQTTMARLPLLSPAAPAVARAVAVLGEEAALSRVAALAGIPLAEARAACDQLADALVLESGAPLRFVHPIIRNAVYEDMAPSQRVALHDRAAELLAEEDVGLDRIAPHLLAVEPRDDPSMVARLRRASADALGRGAAGAAVAYLRRALIEPPDRAEWPDVLLELGVAELLVRGPAAIDHLTEALERQETAAGRAAVAGVLARALIFADRSAEAVAVAGRAISELGAGEAERRRALEAIVLAVAYTDPEFATLREALAERLREQDGLEADDVGAKALTVGLAYLDAQACVPAIEVLPRVQRGLAGGRLLEHDNGGADFVAAVIVLAMADSELALPTITEGLELARERGDAFAWAAGKIFACLAHGIRGELPAAVDAGQEGLAASDDYGIAIGRPVGSGYLATALLEAGDVEGAERTLMRADPPREIPFQWFWAPFADARGRLRLARRDLRGALEDSLWCGELLGALGARNPAFVPWRSRAALCLAQLGEQPERARALVEEEVALARRWGAPRSLGASLRAYGLVVGGAAGNASLRDAITVLESSPARLEHARALVDLGSALRREGRRRDCREPLREGMDRAWRCGARTLAETARMELRASGVRPRRLVRSGLESLTPSERRVAQMAADGLANREIAQALYVTTKTVESHLREAYRKLDVGSREELPRALAPGLSETV